jgi:hypothetical protein
MASANLKWTQDLRKILYARLTMEFGSHDEWGKMSFPDGRKARYHEVLKELAEYFSRLTGDTFAWTAVQQQVDWGRTRQEEIRDNYLRQYILNKAAAIEMGFLQPSSLPATVLADMGELEQSH